MANLTITVDEETLRRARIRAIEEGDSVNHYLAQRLADYAREDAVGDRREQAAERLVELSRQLARSGDGRGWTREELWEDVRGGLRP